MKTRVYVRWKVIERPHDWSLPTEGAGSFRFPSAWLAGVFVRLIRRWCWKRG